MNTSKLDPVEEIVNQNEMAGSVVQNGTTAGHTSGRRNEYEAINGVQQSNGGLTQSNSGKKERGKRPRE